MEVLKDLKIFKNFFNSINNGLQVDLSGFTDSEKAILISSTNHFFDKKIMIVAPDLISAGNLENMLIALGHKVQVVKEFVKTNFSMLEWQKKEREINKAENLSKQVIDYCLGDSDIMIFLPSTINQNIFDFQTIYSQNLTLKVGENYKRDFLLSSLINLGFTRTTEKPINNEFLILGDILKVNYNSNIYVVDFFGDEIESITTEDKSKLDKLEIVSTMLKFNDGDVEQNLFLNILQSVKPMLFVSEPRHILDEIYYQKIEDNSSKNKSKKFITKDNFFIEIEKIMQNYGIFREIYVDFSENIQITNRTVGARKYFYDYKSLVSDLLYYQNSGFKVVLFCGSKDSEKSLFNYLAGSVRGIQILNENNCKNLSGIYLSDFNLPMSASFLQDKIVLLGTDDLIKKSSLKINKYISKKSIYLPKVGDYVVHELHGIGKCVQIERLKILNHEKDYVVVEYRGGDRLYVPSEQLNLLSAYIGSDEEPRLNTIGGVEFARQKEKVKASVKKMTFDLLKLYAEREKRKGYVYEKDNYLYDEFEKSFPYEETEDQLKAIADIKRDMESDKILDRLICGDVGYGKTEVALRAAYKAVLSGKQVAFLCPTTVLSEQHYNTCKERFKDFMVNVEVLNRFKSQKREVEPILQKLAEGKIDIICGTHRLLNKDVKFKDLGLLILDEEQKFGVEHKDKIKQIKTDIDVLTLSATPIPRTLQMSLSGIRDISLIETPPKNRLPVQTYVCEYSDQLLVDACKKEISRNGQVFIIYNEIKTIDDFASRVHELLPDAQIGVAHAEMSKQLLKQTITKMYNQEYDIVIATTLIENGIDNPFANTLIVINSDRLGLAELYQLRGRVGRSDRLAYAYLTFEPQKMLTENAYKRLEALSQFTELGSGFKIAMRDLEIRGAGDVLGREQHGHLTKIGYELYNKMVAEAVDELRGQKRKEVKEIKLDIAIDAYVSSEFVKEESERIAIYSKISELFMVEQFENLKSELESSIGELPKETINLMKIGLLKNLAQDNYVQRVVMNDKECKFVLYKQEKIVTDEIAAALKEFRNETSLQFEKDPIINFKLSMNSDEKLDFLIRFLSLKKSEN